MLGVGGIAELNGSVLSRCGLYVLHVLFAERAGFRPRVSGFRLRGVLICLGSILCINSIIIPQTFWLFLLPLNLILD